MNAASIEGGVDPEREAERRAVVAAIEKLTERQKEAIKDAQWIGSGLTSMCVTEFTGPWEAPVAQFLTLHSDRLTPLGIAVRSTLSTIRKDGP